jgi:hypothetical protein
VVVSTCLRNLGLDHIGSYEEYNYIKSISSNQSLGWAQLSAARIAGACDHMQTTGFLFHFQLTGDLKATGAWLSVFMVMITIQGSLTMGLHCAEVIMNLFRDETAWRKALGPTGANLSSNPISSVLRSWPNAGLLVVKPVLRELCHPMISFLSQMLHNDEFRLDVRPLFEYWFFNDLLLSTCHYHNYYIILTLSVPTMLPPNGFNPRPCTRFLV